MKAILFFIIHYFYDIYTFRVEKGISDFYIIDTMSDLCERFLYGPSGNRIEREKKE